MEPISILVSALGLAANQIVQPLANHAVKNAYDGLRTSIVGRFGTHKPNLESLLADHGKNPDTQRTVTETARKDGGADRDQEVIDQAVQLLSLLEETRPGITSGLIGQINAQGGKVVVISGDVGTINL